MTGETLPDVEELYFQGQKTKAETDADKERKRARTVVIVALCFCYTVTLLAVVVVMVVWSKDSVVRTCVEGGGSWTAQDECVRPGEGDGAQVVPQPAP